ncbi:MAG: hypothetical protein PW734_06895 [Verrucomicrobium sp.]|nr:hypothetical protein [Verrucomicrobium sp.]
MRDHLHFLVGALGFGSLIAAATAALVELPSPPALSKAGHQLILDYEVGGGRSYYDRFLQRPSWPGESSGVTIGVGYDLSTVEPDIIREDWHDIPSNPLDRLVATQPFHGPSAKPKAAQVADILVSWSLALDVFDRVDVTRFWFVTRRAFPGFDRLRPNAQAALVSLVFNRGPGMSGPARREMRAIRDAVPREDYDEIARQMRTMKRLWPDSAGLRVRRDAEASLVLTP